MDSTPPPPTNAQFFLKTYPVKPSTEEKPSNYAPLYLRLHGDGIDSVVLTKEPPKFLRWEHIEQDPAFGTGRQVATLWKDGRSFGLQVGKPREKYAWEDVAIIERGGNLEFLWEKKEIGGKEVEVLNLKGDENDGKGENGWMATQWVHGHPQLFWVTGKLDKDMPPFCEWVYIVREWLIPRNGA
jgi:hypothetical protein